MAEHTFPIDIAAPPELVYDIWADPERSPEWTEGVIRVTDMIGKTGQAGTRYTVWFGRVRAAVEVTAAERPRRLSWRTHVGPLRAEFDSILEPSRHGTKLTQTVRTKGVIGWLWNRMLSSGAYKGSFRGELRAFARICEAEFGGDRSLT